MNIEGPFPLTAEQNWILGCCLNAEVGGTGTNRDMILRCCRNAEAGGTGI